MRVAGAGAGRGRGGVRTGARQAGVGAVNARGRQVSGNGSHGVLVDRCAARHRARGSRQAG